MFLGLPIVLFIGAAAWRMSNMISHKEKGPYQIIWKFHLWARRMARKHVWFKKSEVLEGLECEYCNSIWFGGLFTAGYVIFGERFLYLILPLAISTVAIVIKHIVFLVKSVDTRFDQLNNQRTDDSLTLKIRHEQIAVKEPVSSNQWDTLFQDQALKKGGNSHE